MAKKRDLHLVPHGDGWALKREGASRVRSTFTTKREAQKAGRALPKEDKVEFVIHDQGAKFKTPTATATIPIRRKTRSGVDIMSPARVFFQRHCGELG